MMETLSVYVSKLENENKQLHKQIKYMKEAYDEIQIEQLKENEQLKKYEEKWLALMFAETLHYVEILDSEIIVFTSKGRMELIDWYREHKGE